MLIKLYNGLNRFAPGLRLNFRYFSWVPGHRSPTITMADLLPFFDLSLTHPRFLFVSYPPPLCSVSFATLCSSPANPLILRDTKHARPADTAGLVDSSSYLQAFTFVHAFRDLAFRHLSRGFLLASSEEMQRSRKIRVTSGSVNIDEFFFFFFESTHLLFPSCILMSDDFNASYGLFRMPSQLPQGPWANT